MKYTKAQLDGMSDLELNASLHMEVLGSPWIEHADLSANKKHLCLHNIAGDPYFEDVPDYCTNWNDIMPLAVEHKVSLFAYQDAHLWCAQHYFDSVGMRTVIDESPQRAIACCLVLVLQEQ